MPEGPVGSARPVFVRGWSDRRRSRLGWLGGLAAYVVMMLAVWPTLEGSDSFADVAAEYPDALKALFGGDGGIDAITTPAGFTNSYVFSFMLPVLLLVMALSLGAALLGGEQESGLLDLLLGQPVSRTTVALAKAAVVTAQVALVVTGVVIVLLVGGPLVDLDLPVEGVVAAGVGSLLYGTLHGSVALLAGAATGNRSSALAVGTVVGVVGYVITTVSDLVSWAEPLRLLSPLHHATAGNPVLNGMPANYLVLVALIGLVIVATVVVFDRRDLVT